MKLAQVLAVCALTLLVVGPASDVRAEPEDARLREGALYFDQAIAFIRDGKKSVKTVTRFYCDLLDVQLDDPDRKHQEGHLRLWMDAPDKFRQEWRKDRDPTKPGATTKILNGNRLWVVTADSTRRLHGKSGGAEAVAQLKDDRRRLSDLAAFFTLESLKGPGVTFRFEGRTKGDGIFAGHWLRVRRQVAGSPDMIFHLAYVQDEKLGIRATYPGVVTLPGSEATRARTEWYLLSAWKRGAQSRIPGKVQAWTLPEGKKEHAPFFRAWPETVEFNKELDAALFQPPKRK